ncbi:MAG: hypothetical protein H8E55_21280 [Pelagibacterales bacterium]|nr:hypothetical protein [Pelagibacterales bacterium]
MDKFSNFFENHTNPNMQNDLDLTISEVYEVIININVWPLNFHDSKKLKLMRSMVKYFTEKEEYEKCAKLQKYIDELENSK